MERTAELNRRMSMHACLELDLLRLDLLQELLDLRGTSLKKLSIVASRGPAGGGVSLRGGFGVCCQSSGMPSSRSP